MAASDHGPEWVIFHDTAEGWIHFVRATQPDHHWDVVRLDRHLLDPDGNFLVYVADLSLDDVRISIKTTGEHHIPIALHADFNETAFGGPTLPWGDIIRTMWWGYTPWYGGIRPDEWRQADLESIADGFLVYPFGERLRDEDLLEFEDPFAS